MVTAGSQDYRDYSVHSGGLGQGKGQAGHPSRPAGALHLPEGGEPTWGKILVQGIFGILFATFFVSTRTKKSGLKELAAAPLA
jgi:hypothetical protein